MKLAERDAPGQLAEADEPEDSAELEWLGAQYQDLTPGLRSMHGIPDDTRGVFVTEVLPSSPLWDEGVRPGFVISEVNGRGIGGVWDFEEAVSGARAGTFLRFYVELFDSGERRYAGFAIVQAP